MNLHDLHIQTSGISLSFSTTPKPRWPIWKHPTLPQPSPKPLSHKLPVRKPLCQAVARASSSTAFKRLQVTYCTWKTVQLRVSLFVLFRSKFTRRPVFCSPKKRAHTQCAQRHRNFSWLLPTSVDPLWSLLLGWNSETCDQVNPKRTVRPP